MYPEAGADYGAGAGAGAADYYPDTGRSWAYHLEGFIPLILILIIVFFLAIKFEFVTQQTPVIGVVAGLFGPGGKPSEVLVIGNSTAEFLRVLDEQKDLVQYRLRAASSLERNPKEQLAQYDMIVLDMSRQPDKGVSRELGDAIVQFVRTGGKLIVVQDSGIFQKGAPDVIGWKATFGDLVAVECEYVGVGTPSCARRVTLRGRMYRLKEDHRIMQGIEEVPPDRNLPPILFDVFEVAPTGTEVAYIQSDLEVGQTVSGIVEKPLVVGKSIYFNYNPGLTPGVVANTLRYLR